MIELSRSGMTRADIGKAIGLSQTTVSRYLQAYEMFGDDAIDFACDDMDSEKAEDVIKLVAETGTSTMAACRQIGYWHPSIESVTSKTDSSSYGITATSTTIKDALDVGELKAKVEQLQKDLDQANSELSEMKTMLSNTYNLVCSLVRMWR
jgi:predicted transcriptional regulator